ncbi:MAG TPA: hypothetical protein VLM11_08930 [Streptosporangiaceae bacterium]|nr:hypothetical protein [Streptosporangiaceae bacterium]
MGLFRFRGKKNREKAPAELVTEHPSTVQAQPEATRRQVAAETRPNPDQPGWGRSIGQAIGKARDDRTSQQ